MSYLGLLAFENRLEREFEFREGKDWKFKVMTETTEKTEPGKLGLAKPRKLELNKTVGKGQVRQNFSHGRSKMVTVEVRKKRTFAQDSGGHMSEVIAPVVAPISDPKEPAVSDAPAVAAAVTQQSDPARNLTEEEKAARHRALDEAQRRADEPQPVVVVEAPEPAPAAEPKKPKAEPEPEVISEADAAAKIADGEAKLQRQTTPDGKLKEVRGKLTAAATGDDDAHDRAKKGLKGERRPAHAPRREEPRRRAGKLTITEALEEKEERQRSIASIKRERERERQKGQQMRTEGQKILREVVVPEVITVQELANRMAERGHDVVRSLMAMDMMVTINDTIDADAAELVVEEFGHKIKRVSEADVEVGLKREDADEAGLVSRAPVVTIMGHVDHGKTSLLDALRETDVAAHEAGGITQHIGAYQVTVSTGAKITFIDTPGHAAFTEMRSRGAQVTDIVVLCVAADDGIMPQTVEAIHHATAAGVPIIVAINKIDKPGADAGRVRTELLQHNIQVEEMGGDVLSVEVSATKRLNLDKLEEIILLQAELLDFKANPNRAAEGTVVESRVEQGRGSVSTVLIRRGTLRVGDIFVAGSEWGRVRAMFDAYGDAIDEAGPSVPVEVLGLNGTPNAGEEMIAVDSETQAKEVSEFRQRRTREAHAVATARGSLEQMFERIKDGEAEALPVVIKADVHGSVEAIVNAINKMATDEVKVQILHSGVGGVNESDVTLARASGAFIIAFNVRANPQARDMAKRDGTDIRYYSIIYNVIDDLRTALQGMLAPEIRETFLGHAEIREVFAVSKVGKVAGCMVIEGMVKRGSKVRLIRDQVVIHEGDLSQLKRFKDDAKEVKEGNECGMAFANYQDIQVKDMIECFDVEEVARTL